jgi:uncharacterized protein YjiS (DUF1127 family)
MAAGTQQLGLLGAVGRAWTRFRRRQRALNELQALDNAELERIVQDAGLTFSDLVALARQSDDSAALLYRRLEQAGIDLKLIESAVMRDMQRCCSLCDSKTQCAHELDDKPKVASWPGYCPNRQTIEALSAARCH